jgi:hypothetical protein
MDIQGTLIHAYKKGTHYEVSGEMSTFWKTGGSTWYSFQ